MNWEPWTGCYPASEGCANCYFYGPYGKRYQQNTVVKTDKFSWPIKRDKKGEYSIKGNKILATCFATDFFLPEADAWREEAWAMIRERKDIDFLILTKRIDRFPVGLPADWGAGYENVNLGCTVETQKLAEERLPLFLSYPLHRRFVACSPLLEPIDLGPYLHGVDHVSVSGESGRAGRPCQYQWVLDIREQCLKAKVTFWFKSTGTFFQEKDTLEKINPFQQSARAKAFGIDWLDGKRLF